MRNAKNIYIYIQSGNALNHSAVDTQRKAKLYIILKDLVYWKKQLVIKSNNSNSVNYIKCQIISEREYNKAHKKKRYTRRASG